jgi:hypothetical protein
MSRFRQMQCALWQQRTCMSAAPLLQLLNQYIHSSVTPNQCCGCCNRCAVRCLQALFSQTAEHTVASVCLLPLSSCVLLLFPSLWSNVYCMYREGKGAVPAATPYTWHHVTVDCRRHIMSQYTTGDTSCHSTLQATHHVTIHYRRHHVTIHYRRHIMSQYTTGDTSHHNTLQYEFAAWICIVWRLSNGHEVRTLLCAAVDISKKCVLCGTGSMSVNVLKSDSCAECVCTELVGNGLLRFWFDWCICVCASAGFDVLSEKCCYVWRPVVICVYSGWQFGGGGGCDWINMA